MGCITVWDQSWDMGNQANELSRLLDDPDDSMPNLTETECQMQC